MLSRDYILRILQTFFDLTAKLFDGKRKTDEEFELELNHLYNAYFQKSRAFFMNTLPEEIPAVFGEDAFLLEKNSMLAEICYREYQHASDEKSKCDWGLKAKFLYDYLNAHSADYSLIYAARSKELEAIQPSPIS